MAYGATVLADAPRHYWRLADPGGLFFHDIGSAPRALQQGVAGVGFAAPYTGPASDGGSAWVGLGSALNYTDADLALTLPVSLECWFWLHHLQAAAVGFLSVSDGATTLEIGLDSTLHAHAFASGGGASAVAVTTRQQWHHLVLTNTGAAALLYLDAIQVAAPPAAVIGAWAPGFLVGGGGNPSAPLRLANAAIAEVAVFPAALTPARISAHYLAADTIASRPVYRNSGTWSVTTGSAQTVPEAINVLLGDVTKNLGNAP